jgi:hypothetical protein
MRSAWAKRGEAFPSKRGGRRSRDRRAVAWNIQYPGPDGRFGRTDINLVSADNPIGLDRRDAAAKDDITTINQLNLPVDRPVLVNLSSKDVIHSFGLFEMRVKQDAIPGMTIPVWFIPNRIGEYEITCSQLCGLGHFGCADSSPSERRRLQEVVRRSGKGIAAGRGYATASKVRSEMQFERPFVKLIRLLCSCFAKLA